MCLYIYIYTHICIHTQRTLQKWEYLPNYIMQVYSYYIRAEYSLINLHLLTIFTDYASVSHFIFILLILLYLRFLYQFSSIFSFMFSFIHICKCFIQFFICDILPCFPFFSLRFFLLYLFYSLAYFLIY